MSDVQSPSTCGGQRCTNSPRTSSALTAEELQELIDQGLDALRELNITRESEEATIVEGERIHALITQTRALQRGHEEAATRAGRAGAPLEELVTPTEPEAREEPTAPGEPHELQRPRLKLGVRRQGVDGRAWVLASPPGQLLSGPVMVMCGVVVAEPRCVATPVPSRETVASW